MPSSRVGFDAAGVRISPFRILGGFTNRELCLIHQLYQIQLYLNWQADKFGARGLRADEWVVYACDFFEPVFHLLHGEGDHDYKEQLAVLGLTPSRVFPFAWSLISPDVDDPEAADHLADTVVNVISESALLFPDMKPYQRLFILEVDGEGCRERVAEFFTRSQATSELSGEPKENPLPGAEPLKVSEWVEDVSLEQDTANQWIDPSPVPSLVHGGRSSQASNHIQKDWPSPPDWDWDDQTTGEPTRDLLSTFVFDPEHKNATHEWSVIEADGIEYFTSAPGFCAKLSSLVAHGEFGSGSGSVFVFVNALQRRFPVLFASEARKAFNDAPNLTNQLVCGCSDLLRMHALRLCCLAQTAGIADQPATYVRIWELMDGQLQQFFDRPDPETGDYDAFVAILDRGLRRAVIGEKGLLDLAHSQTKGSIEGGPVGEPENDGQHSTKPSANFESGIATLFMHAPAEERTT
ncbi:hypothetical protein MAPG_10090 [Magnaporthiopsis poae ATCC 64411]|uniref:Uncharacterized protein n=1 Tax=Magnaporthiopsis poae (strain ATCC 64411 / 73-15) TaxID=644358 RepID=A0A0C4EBN8_MAGP6|nr:hypothetical protein MAPG_10090 [Magnaporthiopsis poae ATCC 64411]